MSWPFPYNGGSGWGNGYRCNGCGMWVGNGSIHSCGNTYPRPLPAPAVLPPQPVINIQPGVSEERVRELIREALEEFVKDELRRKARNG